MSRFRVRRYRLREWQRLSAERQSTWWCGLNRSTAISLQQRNSIPKRLDKNCRHQATDRETFRIRDPAPLCNSSLGMINAPAAIRFTERLLVPFIRLLSRADCRWPVWQRPNRRAYARSCRLQEYFGSERELNHSPLVVCVSGLLNRRRNHYFLELL